MTRRDYKVPEKRFTREKIVWDFPMGDFRVSGTLKPDGSSRHPPPLSQKNQKIQKSSTVSSY